MFPVTSKPTPPTVFNLDWVHCEEETGAYYQSSLNTYKFVKKKKLKLFILHFKKFHKIYYYYFFQKEIIEHTYICTKCNDNFKFSLSLKSYEE